MAFPVGWSRSVRLYINPQNVDSDLTAFPVLLTHLSLPGSIFGSARSDGGDIRASTDAAGTTQIPVEIAEFDTTDKRAEIWVKPPTTYSSGTTIYLWWGSPSETMPAEDSTYGSENVWTAFEGAWHLTEQGDGTTGEYRDSTANDHDGVADDSIVIITPPSLIDFSFGWGKAQESDSDGYYVIEIPSTGFSVGTGQFGMSTWLNARSVPSGSQGSPSMSKFNGSGRGHRVYISIDADGWPDFIRGDITTFDHVNTDPGDQDSDTWYHCVWTRDSGNNCRLYIDGSEYGSIVDTSDADNGGPLVFLQEYNSYQNFVIRPGRIAQPRFKKSEITAAWVKADYHMQANNAGFIEYSGNPTLYSINI